MMKYRASLTGEPFMYNETVMVTRLLKKGQTKEKIENKIVDENLFQYKTVKSIPKRFRAIWKRLHNVKKELWTLIISGDKDLSRIIVLYMIYCTDLLFKDFIDEVVKEKFLKSDNSLTSSDIDFFFLEKSKLESRVNNWTDETKMKLNQVYRNILQETGFISDKNLQKVLLSRNDKEKLINVDKNIKEFFNSLQI